MKNIIVVSTVFVFLACTEEQITSREFPRVKTDYVTDINGTGATFRADMVSSPGPVSDHGFLWHDQSSPLFENADRISLGPKLTAGAFESLGGKPVGEKPLKGMRVALVREFMVKHTKNDAAISDLQVTHQFYARSAADRRAARMRLASATRGSSPSSAPSMPA